MKMTSNQKMQENRLALKFNFTYRVPQKKLSFSKSGCGKYRCRLKEIHVKFLTNPDEATDAVVEISADSVFNHL